MRWDKLQNHLLVAMVPTQNQHVHELDVRSEAFLEEAARSLASVATTSDVWNVPCVVNAQYELSGF